MSRVGKQPIAVPAGVQLNIDGRTIKVKGPKGELTHQVPEAITTQMEEGQLVVARRDEDRISRALHGLTRTLLSNMVQGVSAGFERTLELVGTGYRAAKAGNRLVLNVGYSHPVEMTPPAGVDIEVPTPTTVIIRGADKQQVGQFAANVRAVRKPEPYLGKGIRYAGERVRRKVGKAGKK